MKKLAVICLSLWFVLTAVSAYRIGRWTVTNEITKTIEKQASPFLLSPPSPWPPVASMPNKEGRMPERSTHNEILKRA